MSCLCPTQIKPGPFYWLKDISFWNEDILGLSVIQMGKIFHFGMRIFWVWVIQMGVNDVKVSSNEKKVGFDSHQRSMITDLQDKHLKLFFYYQDITSETNDLQDTTFETFAILSQNLVLS